MKETIDRLLREGNCHKVVSIVFENPYIEKGALAEQASIDVETLEGILKKLLEAMILLELASQADSSMESRVPKKIYLVNPEAEEKVRNLLS